MKKRLFSRQPKEVVSELVNTEKQTKPEEGQNYDFVSSFGTIGSGDVAVPYINSEWTSKTHKVDFGIQDAFPQLLDQLYYASVLNGTIIDFRVRCAIGGGYTFKNWDSMTAEQQLKIFKFCQLIDLDENLEMLAYELAIHARANIRMVFNDREKWQKEGGRAPIKVDFWHSQNVRKSKNEKMFFYCEDYLRSSFGDPLPKYAPFKYQKEAVVEITEGRKFGVYSIPQYASANNWSVLEHEESILHKANINESIFPSYMITFPKKPANIKEKEEIKKTIERSKGARMASRSLIFFANKAEQMPKIDVIDRQQNDTLFNSTHERTDEKICQAHKIDPIIMGIRVSGKLGSSEEISKSVAIYNEVMIQPFRAKITKAINQLMRICEVDGEFILNPFSIVEAVNETK